MKAWILFSALQAWENFENFENFAIFLKFAVSTGLHIYVEMHLVSW